MIILRFYSAWHMIEWSKPARNRHFAGYAEVNATTDRRFGHSLAEQMIQIWFVTKVSDVFLMFILSLRIPIESFGTQPPCIEADVLLVCGSCCWKCAGRNLDLHWAFFSYMGLYNPNRFVWKYRTLSKKSWLEIWQNRHFLSFYRNSHLGYMV